MQNSHLYVIKLIIFYEIALIRFIDKTQFRLSIIQLLQCSHTLLLLIFFSYLFIFFLENLSLVYISTTTINKTRNREQHIELLPKYNSNIFLKILFFRWDPRAADFLQKMVGLQLSTILVLGSDSKRLPKCTRVQWQVIIRPIMINYNIYKLHTTLLHHLGYIRNQEP